MREISLTALALIFLTGLLGFAFKADAACICRCVNGQVRALCNSTIDIPPICPPRLCPIAPAKIKPLPSLKLNPLGTTSCQQKMVLNPKTYQYEWKRVCR